MNFRYNYLKGHFWLNKWEEAVAFTSEVTHEEKESFSTRKPTNIFLV